MNKHKTKGGISKEQITNAANNLLDEYGADIRKHDVAISIELNNATKDAYWTDRKRLINRIWRKIKLLKGLNPSQTK